MKIYDLITYPLFSSLISANVLVKGGDLNTISQELSEGTEASEAAPYFYKFVVSLKQDNEPYCGGSLINPSVVLTAAHCSEGKAYQKSVSVARHDLSKSSSQEKGIDLRVSQILIHPNYDLQTLQDDIALWKLSTPVPKNLDVNYVTLANNSEFFDQLLPKVTVIGWGYVDYEKEKQAQKLQVASLKILDPKECASRWENEIDMKNKICTLSPDGTQSVCNGDSGGPLFYMRNHNNKIDFVQVGLVSFGEEKCRLQMHLPDGFTRISSYYNWITDSTKALMKTDKNGLDTKARQGFKKLVTLFKSIYSY